MSFEDERTDGEGGVVFGIIKFAIFVGCMVGAVYLLVTVTNSSDWHNYWNQHDTDVKNTYAILDNSNVTCDDLIKLRLENAQGKLNIGPATVGDIRNLYNVKSCGTHWGWFEP